MLHDVRHGDPRPVLVVEDSDDDFDTVVVAATLARLRNVLVRASTAEEASGILARSPAGAFSFVLLDYNLPGMDGLDFLDSARRAGLLAGLPAVVLTTSAHPRDRDVFQSAGASAFHVKSVGYVDCLRTLASIFDLWLKTQPCASDAETCAAARRVP